MRRGILGNLCWPFVIVPQNNSCILERLGKYVAALGPGFHWKVPVIDYVGYRYSLKEQVCNIGSQSAITKDNVMIKIDGVLYYKIVNSFNASYQISSPIDALIYLAQTSMRSEIGKIDLDSTFKERSLLNANIKLALNHASQKWGIECMRYEIKDIKPPEEIKRAMELQAEHERLKRSTILRSEGTMRSEINVAEGVKTSSVLKAEGDAVKIFQEARGLVESLKLIGESLKNPNTEYAVRLKLCENYIRALANILSKAEVVMLPTGQKNELLATAAAAMSLYKKEFNIQSEVEKKVAVPGSDSTATLAAQVLDHTAKKAQKSEPAKAKKKEMDSSDEEK